MQTITLAYCIDNVATADHLEDQLKVAGYRVRHEYNTSDKSSASLSERLTDEDGPILLLISDNYLKSPQCMEGALGLLQRRREHIQPVIIDGKVRGESDEAIPTRFERVSDIIQYINYWQEQYLDLRRQKRKLTEVDEASLEAHLRSVRSISGEIGEFLRLLRQMDFVSWDEFRANDFERLFEFLQDEEGWDRLKANQPAVPVMRERSEREPAEQAAPPPSEEKPEEPEPRESLIEQFEGKKNLRRILDPPPETPEGESSEPEELPGVEATEEERAEPEGGSNGIRFEFEQELREKEHEPEGEKEESPEDMLEELENLLSEEQPGEALAWVEEKLRIFPRQPELLYQAALLRMRKEKDVSAARAALDQLLEEKPDHLDALFLRGELAEHQEQYRQALEDYERVLRQAPDYPNLHYRLGILLANHFREQKRMAAKHLKRAIKRDKSNPDARYQYALLLAEALNKPRKAIRFFEKTLDIEPDHPFAQYDLALLYHKLGERKKAWKAYQKAIAINPELQTAENDEAFSMEELADQTDEPTGVLSEVEASGRDTIEALRHNLVKLEKLLSERDKLEKQKTGFSRKQEPQTVLITGATSGIGRATARLFAREGFRVILCGRRKDRLERLQKRFARRFNNPHTYILHLDVRDLGSLKEALIQMPDEWKEVDILVNNAGKALGLNPIFTGNPAEWDEMIDTNIKGLLYLTRMVSPNMVRRRKGHIINVGSTAGKEVYPNGNVYCATKFAVDALTKGMRLDLHPFGIRVSQVSPAHVEETEFAKVRFLGDAEKAKIYNDFQPLRARDVARAIFFMATLPERITVHDLVLSGTQQANSFIIDRSGRDRYEEEEE